jgi:hypothetical protein
LPLATHSPPRALFPSVVSRYSSFVSACPHPYRLDLYPSVVSRYSSFVPGHALTACSSVVSRYSSFVNANENAFRSALQNPPDQSLGRTQIFTVMDLVNNLGNATSQVMAPTTIAADVFIAIITITTSTTSTMTTHHHCHRCVWVSHTRARYSLHQHHHHVHDVDDDTHHHCRRCVWVSHTRTRYSLQTAPSPRCTLSTITTHHHHCNSVSWS